MRRFIGLIIGAGFGTLFVLINSGPPLDPTVTLALRVLAVLGFVALVVGTVLIGRPSSSPDSRSDADPEPATGPQMDQFGTGYRIVVAAEVVLLFGDFRCCAGSRHPPRPVSPGWPLWSGAGLPTPSRSTPARRRAAGDQDTTTLMILPGTMTRRRTVLPAVCLAKSSLPVSRSRI